MRNSQQGTFQMGLQRRDQVANDKEQKPCETAAVKTRCETFNATDPDGRAQALSPTLALRNTEKEDHRAASDPREE